MYLFGIHENLLVCKYINAMEFLNKEICRTCLTKKSKELEPILSYVDDLAVCASVYVQPNDELSKKICKTCVSKLKEILEFRRQCQVSKNAFLFALKKKKSLRVANKINLNNDDRKQCDEFNNETGEVISNEENYMKIESVLVEINEGIDIEKESKEKIDINCVKIENKDESFVYDKCDNTNLQVNYVKPEKIKLDDESSQSLVNESNLCVKENIDAERYICKICNKEYPTIYKFRSHIYVHSRRGKHLCQICGKQFTFPENLARHEDIHNKVFRFKCPICPDRAFVQQCQLKSHLITHKEQEIHLCNICGSKYNRAHSLRKHIRQKHTVSDQTFPCTACDKVFKNRQALTCHMRYHKPPRFTCVICEKKFKRKHHLDTHQLIHTNERPYQCSLCSRAFRQKPLLTYHMKSHQS